MNEVDLHSTKGYYQNLLDLYPLWLAEHVKHTGQLAPQQYDWNDGNISELHHTQHFKLLTEALRENHPTSCIILVQAGWDEWKQKEKRGGKMYALTVRFVGLSGVRNTFLCVQSF